MAKFIELKDIGNVEHNINVDWIAEIYENYDDTHGEPMTSIVMGLSGGEQRLFHIINTRLKRAEVMKLIAN